MLKFRNICRFQLKWYFICKLLECVRPGTLSFKWWPVNGLFTIYFQSTILFIQLMNDKRNLVVGFELTTSRSRVSPPSSSLWTFNIFSFDNNDGFKKVFIYNCHLQHERWRHLVPTYQAASHRNHQLHHHGQDLKWHFTSKCYKSIFHVYSKIRRYFHKQMLAYLGCNKPLRLDVISHMTSFEKSEYFISA